MEQSVRKWFDELELIDKLCDIARLVDPVKKSVITRGSEPASAFTMNCFDFWERNKVCDNCISIRAFHENQSYVKIEYLNTQVFMITAIPHQLPDRRVVIELLKDVTDSMFLSSGETGTTNRTNEIHKMIDNMNAINMKDALTGIFNRRYIGEKLPVDILNTALLSQDISLIMADIDHFKMVNDTYGHLAGDCALKQFARTLAGCLHRSTDWVARYGGEEFLICLPGAGNEMACKIAEQMRQAVASAPVTCADTPITITSSFGVYTVRPHQSENLEQLVRQVDERLYRAKRNGRNRVES